MEPRDFSEKYDVRPITDEDIGSVYDLCRKNSLFYEYCPPAVTKESIHGDREALPPGKSLEDKYYVGYFDGSRLVAVMDLIDRYPDPRTVFIGFFMTDISVQNKGVGTRIIRELCEYLRRQGYGAVRLGWAKGNPQSEHFWHKNDFAETGILNKTENYTVVVAQKELWPEPMDNLFVS